jgi:hypothetical protein
MKRAGVALIVIVALGATVVPELAVAAMKMIALIVPLPVDNQPIPLSGLRYGGDWTIEFTSVRLERVSEEGEDPIRLVWTLTGRSTRTRVQKVDLIIALVTEKKKILSSERNSVIVKSRAEHQEFIIESKVKAKAWNRATHVKIQANFEVL